MDCNRIVWEEEQALNKYYNLAKLCPQLKSAATVAPTNITEYIAYIYILLQLLDIKIHLLFYIVYYNDLLGIKY